MTRQELIANLKLYKTSFPEEHQFKSQFLELLQHPQCYHRNHLPGHMTGSSFIVDDTGQFTLLTLHAKLNRWLQPGGHADGEEDILKVALKEAEEETGLASFQARPAIFDIDIHTIPSSKDFPEHIHFDIRFLLRTSRHTALSISKESKSLAWIPMEELADVTQNLSILRMAKKVNLTGGDQ